jgi:opacity protein-like surface antigen
LLQNHESFAFPFDYDQKGWLIGGQVGVNKVLGGAVHGLVVGAEVTASLSGISGILDPFAGLELERRGDNNPFGGVGTYPWLATATAKLGWTGGNWMIYGEIGVGLGGFDFESPLCSFEQVNQGLVWGFGAEAAIGNNNSLFIEWNRMDFADSDSNCGDVYITPGSIAFPIPVGVHRDARIDVVRVGFNHYFNH